MVEIFAVSAIVMSLLAIVVLKELSNALQDNKSFVDETLEKTSGPTCPKGSTRI